MNISVVIAAYNADNYLHDAVASVLAQTLPPDEVIVVAQETTSRTHAILSAFGDKVRWTTRERRGAAASLNIGLSMAGGALLAFQDADDLWLPEKLAFQCAALDRHPQVEAVFGHMRQFVSSDVPEGRKAELAPRQEVLAGVSKVTMLIRRTSFDRVGLFDESMRNVEFLDWYARASRSQLKTLMLPDIVALRRLHSSNIGRTDAQARDKENLAALHRLMASRRNR
jgi:glycosyltransferase involved in cell wall biosynthesis